MIKEIFRSKRYWKSVGFLALGFMVMISIVEHLMHYHGINIEDFVNQRLAEGRWIRYLFSRVAGGTIYGLIMGYYMELRKRKAKR